MNLIRKYYILTLLLLLSILSVAQNIDIHEIKGLKKSITNKNTYTYSRIQKIELNSFIWKKSAIKRKLLIKSIFPKVYNFLEANTSFELELILQGIRKNKLIKEKLISSYSTGLIRPKLISLALQNQYSDLSFKTLKIAGKKYYNPIYFPRKYHFIKSINKGDNTTLTSYEFKPKKISKFLLTGHFNLIDETEIDYFKAQPSINKSKIKSQILFENTFKENILLPSYNESITSILSNKKSLGGLEIKSSNSIDSITFSKNKLRYSNIILDFDDQNIETDTIDKNSIVINKTLNYIEALRYGKLGINKFDVLLKHLVGYNPWEGLRLGLGIGTNEKFSKTIDFGGYFAFGNKDDNFKYGGFTNLYLDKKGNSKLKVTYLDDLIEPGVVIFPYSKRLFLNEGFRKFGISNFDRSKRFDATLSTSILSNIFIQTNYTQKHHKPLYAYSFQNSNSFSVSEISFGLRYNPDEKFFKMSNRLYSLGSKYPSFFINYSQSLSTEFIYKRVDAKVEKKLNLMEYGVIDFQVIGGIINNNELPYPFAYNMKGSYKPGTPIINNTFGTMIYNEFIATKYAAIFYNHNIGKIANRETFAPELILVQNMGIGNKINTLKHHLIDLKSMEKGFLESGVYLKNLFSFQNIIGKTGFGMGFMYRYGPYRYGNELDNLVFKFSIDIDI